MFTTIIRTVILYLLVVLAMRIMGKRQIGDMQPSELVVTLLISEIASIPMQDTSQPILSAFIAIFTLISVEIFLTVISLKSNFINNLTNGKSAIIIKNGVILQKELKKLRITVADLIEMLRTQGIFNIEEVNYAILETNGTLSVLQKPIYKTVTCADLKIKTNNLLCPSLVISDGKFLNNGIKEVNSSIEKIEELLKKENKKPSDVFIMMLDSSNNYIVVEKEHN